MAKKKTKTSRKSTRRIKKPKYLSLRLQFSGKESQKSKDHMPCSTTTSDRQQLKLFPLHPQITFQEEEKDTHDENMEYLLSGSDSGATTTLTGLLGSATASSSIDGTDELSPTGLLGRQDSEAVKLVRTALRSRERDPSEERYVRYSEVVERRDEEVSSRVGDVQCRNQMTRPRRLSLKLDYQVILSAWSDKAPFYIHSDFPQTVPVINEHDFLSHDISNGENGGFGDEKGGWWRVPEGNGGAEPKLKMEEAPLVGSLDDENREQWKWKVGGHREASVLRYKEKRRNRLFSKTIRYQVRKENAEKRPRVKGRFVKRS